VTFSAIALLFLASIVHSWYAGNVSLPRGQAASLIRDHGSLVFIVFTLLLTAALILLWMAKGFWCAAVGAIAYFFLLPLITYPLLSSIGLVPAKRDSLR